jgi:hypothetical protein
LKTGNTTFSGNNFFTFHPQFLATFQHFEDTKSTGKLKILLSTSSPAVAAT